MFINDLSYWQVRRIYYPVEKKNKVVEKVLRGLKTKNSADKNGKKKIPRERINKSFVVRWKQFPTAIIHSSSAAASNALLAKIDNESLLDVDNELYAHVFNSRGWVGGVSNEARTNDTLFKVTEFLLNLTHVKDENFTSASENIKLLSPLNNQSVHGNFSADQNSSGDYEPPHIPEYIRTTSIVFCIVILCLGLIGNIMVNSRKDV